MRDRISPRRFFADERGAVATTYALALVGLVVAAGVGYDYAQVATLDTELQNAADQAALAGATQLDGNANAIARAKTAAQTYVANTSLMANDGGTSAVAIDSASYAFYATKTDAENDTNAVTADASAKYVKVSIVSRKAHYTLTPIISRVVQSGSINASATAGLGSSICKVPPVMMCNPAANPAVFDVASYIGKGLLLVAHGNGGSYAPGDFGYLDVGAGANALGKLLGYANPPGDCVDITAPTTQPGSMASVINDFNTRFDIFDNGDSNNCYGSSLCPPSDNSRKDVIQPGTLTTSSSLTKQDCGFTTGKGGKGWQFSDGVYRPASAATCTSLIAAGSTCRADGDKTLYPDAMGYPRDFKHAWANPAMNTDRIGDGTWDIDAYWRTNYNGAAWAGQVTTAVAGRSYPTRYEIYKWERANPGTGYRQFGTGSNKSTAFQAPMCRPGFVPGGTKPDRRVIPVAVVNCTGLNGAQQVNPIDWMDVFLVEPSLPRKDSSNNSISSTGDIYVEVVSRTTQGSEGATSQIVRRDKPYLVK